MIYNPNSRWFCRGIFLALPRFGGTGPTSVHRQAASCWSGLLIVKEKGICGGDHLSLFWAKRENAAELRLKEQRDGGGRLFES